MLNLKVIYCRTQFWFGLNSGGSVGHTIGVLKGFKENNCDIKLITNERFYGSESFKPFVYEPIIKSPIWLAELLYNLTAYKFFKRNVLKIKPDFIYHRFTGYTFFISRIAKVLKTPLILEFNSFDSWKIKHWERSSNLVKKIFQQSIIYRIVKQAEEYNLKSSSLIVTVSDVLKSELISYGISEDKIVFLPNAVDINKFDPDSIPGSVTDELRKKLNLVRGKTVIGFSGTFGRWHGIPQLTEAIEIILKNNLSGDIVFLIIGGGGELKELMHKRLSKYKEVIFTGIVPYSVIQDYLKLCDILVSPHCPQADGREFFGSPTKLFEYMAMGRGIIASDLGQIGDILEDGKDAVLVEPGNVNKLVDKIIFLAKDKRLIKELGMNARKKAKENYTWDKNIKRLLDTIITRNIVSG